MKKDLVAPSPTAIKSATPVIFQTKMAQAVAMLCSVAAHFVRLPVLVVTDSWFGNNGLFRPLQASAFTFNLLSRLRSNNHLHDLPPQRNAHQRGRSRKYGEKLGSVSTLATAYREKAQTLSVFLYGKQREVLAYERVVMLRNLRAPARVVWVFRKTRWVALFTTDRTLSVQQIIEYYGARWKIESGFKEIKQEIGSAKSQTRNAHAVINHLNFCMMAATVTWIYADRIQSEPQRRHQVPGRASYAFSDVRRLIANAALTEDFSGLWTIQPKPRQNSFVATLLRRQLLDLL